MKSKGIPRILDCVLAGMGLILLLPILLICAACIKYSSPGPVFFRQERMGRDGRTFSLIKFRTMSPGKQSIQVTAGDDPRITPIGKVLRKLKLDELPELWNIFKGDMAIVGPRPEVPRYVDLHNPLWKQVLKIRPGLTDPVTIRLRNEESLMQNVGKEREKFYLEVLQPYKLVGYLKYEMRRSFFSDIKVILLTIAVIAIPSLAPPPTMDEIRNSRHF